MTITALRKANYSGAWYIVLDTDDETAPEYARKWGEDRLLFFDKAAVEGTFDIGDNGGSNAVVVHARNAVDGLAQELGLSYFLELDDDYTYFAHRIPKPSPSGGTLTYAYVYHFDELLDACIDFLESSGALTVAFAQGGDYTAGLRGAWATAPIRRKAMNTFICKVGRPIGFVGRINEDTTTYVWRGGQGELFFTLMDLAINQFETQQQEGGLTTAYLDVGTYVKSFYTVMWAPSCTKVSTLGDLYQRIHHQVSWGHAVPKILSPAHKRAQPEGATHAAS
jgi:hypothetical protein